MNTTNPAHVLFKKLRAEGKEAILMENGWGPRKECFVAVVDPRVKVPRGEKGLVFIRDFLKKHNKKPTSAGTPPFTKGFVGFLSYELGAKWQGTENQKSKIKKSLPAGRQENYAVPQSGTTIPVAHFVYVDKVFSFKSPPAHSNLQQFKEKVIPGPWRLGLSSPLSKKEYLKKIRTIKNYLSAGETYQVNFSQKFSAPYAGDAFELYQRLTALNPSPHQFFMETPKFAVISNSPEQLFSVTLRQAQGDMHIQTRPIKGTIARGRTTAEDRQNIQKLLNSEKEKAELAMIVDLERNDLGKICTHGTVRVVEQRGIEKYSHVIHTVATIEGALAEGHDFLDALHALFPGGSVTGCPKKRTMEIIVGLEGEPRGVYYGSAGYIDLSGACDFNIMIRTLLLKKTESKIVFRSGGGIIVDSEGESEYQEMHHKAEAMVRSIMYN